MTTTAATPDAATDADRLLTEHEAADAMGITITDLRHLAVDSRGPRRIRLGRRFVYRSIDVDFWNSRPALATGPVQCAPWCEYRDGHVGVMYADDQRCYSPLLRTNLTLHEPFDPQFPEEGDYVEVFLARVRGMVTVDVMLHDEDCLRMTLDEARQLRDHLDAVLRLAGAEL